jgi:hypothetical protein
MGRTACTEPQCLHSRAIHLLPLWAVQPVQSRSACTRVTFTLPFYCNMLCSVYMVTQNKIVVLFSEFEYL